MLPELSELSQQEVFTDQNVHPVLKFPRAFILCITDITLPAFNFSRFKMSTLRSHATRTSLTMLTLEVAREGAEEHQAEERTTIEVISDIFDYFLNTFSNQSRDYSNL